MKARLSLGGGPVGGGGRGMRRGGRGRGRGGRGGSGYVEMNGSPRGEYLNYTKYSSTITPFHTCPQI